MSREKLVKIILGSILFFTVIAVFGFIVSDIWFHIDDVGNILNGLIKSWT